MSEIQDNLAVASVISLPVKEVWISNSNKVVFKEPLIEQAVRLQLNLNESQIINKDDLLNELNSYSY